MQLTRYLSAGLMALAAVVVIVLLVRPFIFSFSAPRGDDNYNVTSSARAANRPQLVPVRLIDPHGLLGEVEVGENAQITVVVAADATGGFSVVNAWSPTNDCAVTLGPDRLVDCEGHAWTYAGAPIDTADAPLQRFPATERNGAVIADFTQPIGL